MTIRIAIFDDNNNIRNSIVLLLSTAPEIEVVGNFRDALHCVDKIMACKPDIVLMDIEMPGVNGIDALKTIKAAFPHVSVLMQTVFEDDDRVLDAIRAGASGYIVKTSLTQSLVDAIYEMQSGSAPMTPWVARKVLNMVHSAQQAKQKNAPASHLTPAEKDVLTRIVNGQSYKTIATDLTISYETVQGHIKKIYERLKVDSLAGIVSKPTKKSA